MSDLFLQQQAIQPMFTDVEIMAAHYVEQIRSVQPNGPYYLGGLCTAGIIAFEMAQRLRERGHAVALLALLDTPLPSSTLVAHGLLGVRNLVHFGRRLLYTTRQNLRRGPREWLKLPSNIGKEMKQMVVSNPVPQANKKAGRKYIAKAYPGPIEMFLPEKRTFGFSQSRRLAWSKLAAGGLRAHYVPGNQAEMMREPHVGVLAQKLEKCMHEATRSPARNG